MATSYQRWWWLEGSMTHAERKSCHPRIWYTAKLTSNMRAKHIPRSVKTDICVASSHIQNYIKCEWMKYPIQKTEIVSLNLKKQDTLSARGTS